MRQRVARLALTAGATVLAALLLLTMCGTAGDDGEDGASGSTPRAATGTAAPPLTRLAVPGGYQPRPRWELPDASLGYAITPASGRIAQLERVGPGRFRLRAFDIDSGRPVWTGRPWHPPASADRRSGPGAAVPRLLSVAKDGREYLVVWSFGTAGGDDVLTATETFVVLDVYDAETGGRQRTELPWPTPPTVSGTGPGILVGDGRTRNAVVDPATGEVTRVPETALAHPKGCAGCRRLTEVRGVTAKGLLLSGETGFWVRGGWYSGNTAPAGTDRASGVPTAVAPGRLLAKWRPAKGRKDAPTHEVWAVHDTASGKPLVQTRCQKPAIEPGEHPRAVLSPGGGHLVAGNLVFDLQRRKGRCVEPAGDSRPLTLTSVTDTGTAYGAIGARNAPDALAGGGVPVELGPGSATPRPLGPTVRLPGAEAAGVGVFGWTDTKDRLRLLGHPRRK